MFDGQIPAAANVQQFAFGLNHCQAFIGCRQTFQNLAGAVCGMIVYHYQVEIERTLLFQGRLNGIGDGTCPVADRNDHRGFGGEITLVQFDRFGSRSQPGSDALEVCRTYSLHFELVVPVFGIHVGKVSLFAVFHIAGLEAIKVFLEVNNRKMLRKP